MVCEPILAFFLGPRELGPPSPHRIRDENFVALLLIVLPLMVLSALLEGLFHPNAFVVINTALSLDTILTLWLIRKRKVGAPVIFLFGALLFMSGYYFFLFFTNPVVAVHLVPFVALVYGAILLLDGVYSPWNLTAPIIYSLILLFDSLAWFFYPLWNEIFFVNLWLAIGMLHTLVFFINLFIRSYYRRLEQLALARKRMNQRLEELLKEVRESGIQRLASFSHDIRSPLTSIMAVQAMLAATDLTEEQKRYVDVLGRSNKLMLDLVESVLNPETPRNGLRSTSLHDTVEELLAPHRSLMALRNIQLVNRVPKKVRFPRLERNDLVRILSNLIDNGLKYTQAGELSVGAEEYKAKDGEKIRLWVEDSGPGFLPETIQAIMEDRVQPDIHFSSSHALGLRGVRALVSQYKGTMRIENRPQGGARILLELPF
ncbi:MAG TPA: HAMP domain-containing sensor histidine kinase [Termitinemataceae bacterium]|nr:HAMP domain-containing sensor histidine kinase [Termitinemataceae bacterium]HOM23541.1 HAMP domain-containing sensor histidine kinase [Termitinemataceae bacterium]HPP99668.1 HAMP domain-containing sensor histidine kinase [Termitinemataceae bacterium]